MKAVWIVCLISSALVLGHTASAAQQKILCTPAGAVSRSGADHDLGFTFELTLTNAYPQSDARSIDASAVIKVSDSGIGHSLRVTRSVNAEDGRTITLITDVQDNALFLDASTGYDLEIPRGLLGRKFRGEHLDLTGTREGSASPVWPISYDLDCRSEIQ